MAEGSSKPSEQDEINAERLTADVKQLESQLVSLNFMIKNTQSEVIKLQRMLARQQTHQEESDKKLAAFRKTLDEYGADKKSLAGFKQIFWFSQIGVIIITLILVMLLKGILIGDSKSNTGSPNKNISTSESPSPSPSPSPSLNQEQ